MADSPPMVAAPEPFEFVSEQQLEQPRTIYIDMCKTLGDHEHELDKAIAASVLTLGGGSLGFALVMLRDSPSTAAHTFILIAAALIGLAMLLAILDLFLNRRAYQTFRRILDEEFGRDPVDFCAAAWRRQDAHWISKYQHRLGLEMLILLGVGFVLIFAAAAQPHSPPPPAPAAQECSQ